MPKSKSKQVVQAMCEALRVDERGAGVTKALVEAATSPEVASIAVRGLTDPCSVTPTK